MVTWELYSSLHNKVKETEFPAAEIEAEMDARSVIGPRFDTITEATYGYKVLQETICRIIDHKADSAKSGAGTGVTSVSNDGYSVSYSATTQEQLQQELKASIAEWLSGTGLIGAY